MDKLIITSADGHAVIPTELWAKYVDKKYHKYLQKLIADKSIFTRSVQLLNDQMLNDAALNIYDKERAYRNGGWKGLWDVNVRMQELDREGVAAEFVFPGDLRNVDTFWNTVNDTYALDAVDSGAQSYNRWSHDTFVSGLGRLLLIGAPITGLDQNISLSEIAWLAKKGFTGQYTPGYMSVPGQIPVYDKYWDPVWASYVDHNLVLISHAGWGIPQGYMHSEAAACVAEANAEQGDDWVLMRKLSEGIFNETGVFADLRSRQGMWMMMLGGVFDRHPKLRMMETEIRADWIPATLKLLDRVWEANRDKLPAKRRPSEYWATNCMAGLSFMNRAEVELRSEIGIKQMAFGRDYPHTESTWPNTREYLPQIFRGVSESDVRDIMGENMVRFLGLDRNEMAKIAQRINAPTYQQIRDGSDLEPTLKAHLDMRCGFSNPPEGERRVPEMEAILFPDIPKIANSAMAFS